jgi:hypothetical protein
VESVWGERKEEVKNDEIGREGRQGAGRQGVTGEDNVGRAVTGGRRTARGG